MLQAGAMALILDGEDLTPAVLKQRLINMYVDTISKVL